MAATIQQIRTLALATSALACPLLIATTVVAETRWRGYYWRNSLPTAFGFGFMPIVATIAASIITIACQRRHGRLPKPRIVWLDLLAATMYVGVLIPIWARDVGDLGQSGLGLLVGYTTAPMIVNMFIHFYMIWIQRHALQPSGLVCVRQCPNCQHKYSAVPQIQVQESESGPSEYSLLRGEVYLDEDAVPYATPRQSEDAQLLPEKEGGKGKATEATEEV